MELTLNLTATSKFMTNFADEKLWEERDLCKSSKAFSREENDILQIKLVNTCRNPPKPAETEIKKEIINLAQDKASSRYYF